MTVGAVACATSNEEVFHLSDNFLLLAAGQIGSSFKKLLHFAGGSGPASLGRLASNQEIGADTKQLGKDGQLLWAHCRGFAFPKGVGTMRDAELFGNLRLRQPCCFSQLIQPLAERRALTI